MSNKKVLIAAVVLSLSVVVLTAQRVAAQPTGCAESVAVVAGSDPVPSGDTWLIDALEQRVGDPACVVVFDDSIAQPSDLADFDAAVISSSVSPSAVGDTLADVNVPILVSEPYLWDDMGMTSATGRETVPVVAMHVADPTHPLSGGLSGTLNVLSSADPINYAFTTHLGAAADVVALVRSTGGGATKATLFAYDEGDPMLGGSAPATRIGFFAGYDPDLTENGDALVDAALDVLLADGVNLPPTSIGLDDTVVAENDAGATIGTLVVTDPNPGDDPVLTVDDARFEVSPANDLTLAPGVALDHETEPSVAIEITATDQGGLQLTTAFVLTVVDDPLDNASTDDIAALQTQIDALEATIDALTAQNAFLAAGLERIEAALDPDADGTLNVSAPDDRTIRFEGVDVQITNGLGQTECNTPEVTTVIPAPAPTCNGTGNLVLGYNEPNRDQSDTEVRNGSHNLIIGTDHSYASFASVIVGGNNSGLGREAVIFGTKNTATASSAVIMGGRENTASGVNSVVFGHTNTASGYQSAVTGGQFNQATGDYSVVAGGHENLASGEFSVVTAGTGNTAVGYQSAVAGGLFNQATGDNSAVAGGYLNFASGELSVVSAGTSNVASAYSATVSGGSNNSASAERSTVSGGFSNVASAFSATVSGGSNNSASASGSTVSGGQDNTATADSSTVSGGRDNTASAVGSSVTGGWGNSVSPTTEYGTVSGGTGMVLNAPGSTGWWGTPDFISSSEGNDGSALLSSDVRDEICSFAGPC